MSRAILTVVHHPASASACSHIDARIPLFGDFCTLFGDLNFPSERKKSLHYRNVGILGAIHHGITLEIAKIGI